MQTLLLSRITKDFLNQDPAFVPTRHRYRMGWSGSILSRYSTKSPSFPLSAPRLPSPSPLPNGTFRPACYFSRGVLDQTSRKNPDPIWYLLTETNETAKARPVPGNFMLIRSLCKGKGILRQNNQGLVFLDVDNHFISAFIPFLEYQGLVRPPYFNLFTIPEGAHIPVISLREQAFHYLGEIDEIGKEFSFEIEGLYSLQPVSWPEVEQVWFFKINSPALEDFRRRSFLSALPGGHAFHIAVAVKPRPSMNKAPQALPVMRINIAFLAA